MLHLLHLDASGRPGRAGEHPHGSHTRALTHRFVQRWSRAQPGTPVVHRDVGAQPPTPITGDWVGSAFTPAAARTAGQRAVLAESDRLVAELQRADVLVLGVPRYNFGPPAAFKAWVDQVVRIGLTFDYLPEQPDNPYMPLLTDRPRSAVLLTSRGGHGYGPGGDMAAMNHLDPAVRTVLGFIGITDVYSIAIEGEEHKDEAFQQSVALAQTEVDKLVDALVAQGEAACATPALAVA